MIGTSIDSGLYVWLSRRGRNRMIVAQGRFSISAWFLIPPLDTRIQSTAVYKYAYILYSKFEAPSIRTEYEEQNLGWMLPAQINPARIAHPVHHVRGCLRTLQPIARTPSVMVYTTNGLT